MKRGYRQRRFIIICIVAAVILGMLLGQLRFSKYGNRINTDENVPLVKTAVKELGNKHGEKFWSWYGFDERVDWCACFVSWCVAENEENFSDVMDPFCFVPDGVNWFQERNQWKEAGEKPEAGDIIFFDWDCTGIGDHVGIVAACEGDYIFTIEGNSRDECRRKGYPVDSESILGYGVLE